MSKTVFLSKHFVRRAKATPAASKILEEYKKIRQLIDLNAVVRTAAARPGLLNNDAYIFQPLSRTTHQKKIPHTGDTDSLEVCG